MNAVTPHYGLVQPAFNQNTWQDDFNNNMALLDAVIYNALEVSAIEGVWDNTTAYTVGQRVVDAITAAVYTCVVAHTSANTGTFAADRIAHPLYWESQTVLLTPRGAWAKSTVYNVNDLAYQTSEGISAICITGHTSSGGSGDTIRTDSTKWVYVVDLSVNADADTINYDNGTSSLSATDVQAAIDEIVVALNLKAAKASPTFTGVPTAPTPATSDNSTKLATTAYVVAKLATFGVLVNAQVRVATTANITIATALNNGDTIDGVVLATSDRVLVKDQSVASANGVYIVGVTPARAADFDTWDEHVGVIVNVTAGTANTGKSYRSTINLGGTLDSTDITFTQFGSTISLPLDVASGGTGSTTAAAARTALGLAIGTNVLAYDAQLFSNIPLNSQSANYTAIATDAEKGIFHPAADTTARTYTIPANASVAYAVGTCISFINQHGAGVITIAITSDIMRLAGTGTTGNRTLAADGIATAIKITSTEWLISGTGLS
jgi:hypothetical protein